MAGTGGQAMAEGVCVCVCVTGQAVAGRVAGRQKLAGSVGVGRQEGAGSGKWQGVRVGWPGRQAVAGGGAGRQ